MTEGATTVLVWAQRVIAAKAKKDALKPVVVSQREVKRDPFRARIRFIWLGLLIKHERGRDARECGEGQSGEALTSPNTGFRWHIAQFPAGFSSLRVPATFKFRG